MTYEPPNSGPPTQPVAARVGKYLMLDVLGEGAFGKVRLAVDESDGFQYAMKIMDKSHIKANELTLQVRREIAVMKAMRHPNIVNLHEVLTSSKNLYMVMDLVTGGELFDAVAEAGRLPETRSRLYFQQLVDGIHYCHTRGVYHRDLKPENLLLTGDKQTVKITDFGLSSIKAHNASSELLYTIMGSPHYIAPEIITSAAAGYDGAKVDVWASGIILFGMLAGFLPFDEQNTRALYTAIVHNSVSYPPHFSYDVIKLLRAMLQKDPSKRPTMEEIKTYAWFRVDYMPASPPDSSKAPDSVSRKKTKYRLKKNSTERKHRKRDSSKSWKDDEPASMDTTGPHSVGSSHTYSRRRGGTASSSRRSDYSDDFDDATASAASAAAARDERENMDPVLTSGPSSRAAPISAPLPALVIASSDSCKTASSNSLSGGAGQDLSVHPPPDPVYRLPSRRSAPRTYDNTDCEEHAAAVPVHVESLEQQFEHEPLSISFPTRPRYTERGRSSRPPPYTPETRDSSFGPESNQPAQPGGPQDVVADLRLSDLKQYVDAARANMAENGGASSLGGEDSTYSGGQSESSGHSLVASDDGLKDAVNANGTSPVFADKSDSMDNASKKRGDGDERGPNTDDASPPAPEVADTATTGTVDVDASADAVVGADLDAGANAGAEAETDAEGEGGGNNNGAAQRTGDVEKRETSLRRQSARLASPDAGEETAFVRKSALVVSADGSDDRGCEEAEPEPKTSEVLFVSPVSVNEADDAFRSPAERRSKLLPSRISGRNSRGGTGDFEIVRSPSRLRSPGPRARAAGMRSPDRDRIKSPDRDRVRLSDRIKSPDRQVPTLHLDDDAAWSGKDEGGPDTNLSSTMASAGTPGTGMWTTGAGAGTGAVAGTPVSARSGIFKPVKSVFAPLAERLMGQEERRQNAGRMVGPLVDGGTGTNDWCIDSGDVFEDVEAEDGASAPGEDKRRLVRRGRRSMLGFGRSSGKMRRAGADGAATGAPVSKPIFGELSSELATKLASPRLSDAMGAEEARQV